MKKCKCGSTEFYSEKSKECKQCIKNRVKEIYLKKREDPDWVESEKVRAREKYHRLNYKEKHKPTQEAKREAIRKYKEQYPEKYKAKIASQRLPCKQGHELHHWSYNEQHWKDVLEMSIEDHSLLHRYLSYDQNLRLYRRRVDNTLLESKEEHVQELLAILRNDIIVKMMFSI